MSSFQVAEGWGSPGARKRRVVRTSRWPMRSTCTSRAATAERYREADQGVNIIT